MKKRTASIILISLWGLSSLNFYIKHFNEVWTVKLMTPLFILSVIIFTFLLILNKERINKILTQSEIKRAEPSEFIQWLTYANAGMLHEGNIYCMEYAIKNIHSSDMFASPIIEIGSFCGLSTNVISYFLRKHHIKANLFTCDKWIFEGAILNNDIELKGEITHSQYSEFVKQTYLMNVLFFTCGIPPYTIESTSDEFFKAWEIGDVKTDVINRKIQLGGQISFAYIDGNHTYEFAKRDFQNVDKYLMTGGFILFDDSADGSHFEVNKMVKEILREKRYEIVIQNPNYLIKKIT